MQMLVAVKTESSSPTTGETSNTLFAKGTTLINKLSLLLSVLSIVSSCRYQLELFSNLCVGRTRVQWAIQAILPIEIIFRCVPILSYPILTIYLSLPISVNIIHYYYTGVCETNTCRPLCALLTVRCSASYT